VLFASSKGRDLGESLLILLYLALFTAGVNILGSRWGGFLTRTFFDTRGRTLSRTLSLDPL
jgi:hypothetical protein